MPLSDALEFAELLGSLGRAIIRGASAAGDDRGTSSGSPKCTYNNIVSSLYSYLPP